MICGILKERSIDVKRFNDEELIIEEKDLYEKTRPGDNTPSRITKHIWLGGFIDALNIDFLMKHDIVGVFTCAAELGFISVNDLVDIDSDDEECEERCKLFDTQVEYMNKLNRKKVNLEDCEDNREHYIKSIHDMAASIHKLVTEGKNVYVHCAAGVNRSATVLAGYLILYHKLSVEDAVNIIHMRRTCTFGLPYTIKLLRMLSIENVTEK